MKKVLHVKAGLPYMYIYSLPAEKFCMFFLSSADFFKINFFKKFFQEYHQSVKELDPDQARRFFGPDLGPKLFEKAISR